MLSEKLINASGAPTANWDLSYATYTGAGVGYKDITQQTNTVNDLVFSTDGTKMYVLNETTATIYQYSMPTAFDIGAASYDSKSKNISAQETTPKSFAFSSDGTKMYAVGTLYVRYYTLSTPWDISTATYVSLMNPSLDSQLGGITFKPDGTIIYLTGDQSNRVYSIALATAWDIFSYSSFLGTISYDSFTLTTQSTTPKKVFLKSDGTKMYLITKTSFSYEYNLSTPWDIRTATYTGIYDYHGDQGITFSDDGNYLIVSKVTDYVTIAKYPTTFLGVSSPWSLSDIDLYPVSSENGKLDLSSSYTSVYFKNTGTDVYLTLNSAIDQASMSTPWNINTMEYPSNRYSPPNVTNITDMYLNSDGTKMYLYNSSDYKIYQYTLATPWSTNTAISDNKTFTTTETVPTSMSFNNTGTKVFFAGNTNDKIYEYGLSTPWDISTAYSIGFFDFSTPGNPASFCFKNDGSKIYIISDTNSQIYEYRLWVNWSFSGGATLLSTYNASSFIRRPRSIAFDSSGSNLYILALGANLFRIIIQ